ncbi:MAG: hypothetical protein ACLRWQ_00360 [Flavonifractor plautii]
MMMQLRIGFDMGIVLTKGIIFSMLCVFLLMPGLLMLFSGPIERTRHRNLVPHINWFGRGHPPPRIPPLHLSGGAGGLRRAVQPLRLCLRHQRR